MHPLRHPAHTGQSKDSRDRARFHDSSLVMVKAILRSRGRFKIGVCNRIPRARYGGLRVSKMWIGRDHREQLVCPIRPPESTRVSDVVVNSNVGTPRSMAHRLASFSLGFRTRTFSSPPTIRGDRSGLCSHGRTATFHSAVLAVERSSSPGTAGRIRHDLKYEVRHFWPNNSFQRTRARGGRGPDPLNSNR